MKPVVVDCDPGHDDAVALLMAIASPELELLGVTTVAGNQTVAKTTANAIRILDHVGRHDVPVAAGAPRPLVATPRVASEVHGETGLDGSQLPPPGRSPVPQHAIDWLALTLSGRGDPITLVATGPLTNLALFLARYPELQSRVAQIVLMGGSIGEGNTTPAAEFNMWADPEAAQRVVSSGLPVTMVGLDVTHRALMTSAHAQRLAAAGRAGRLVADLFAFYAGFHAQRYGWEGAPVHDAVALAHVIDPAILSIVPCGIMVETGDGLSRGRTHVDRTGGMDWSRCQVAVDIDAERFFALLVARISTLG